MIFSCILCFRDKSNSLSVVCHLFSTKLSTEMSGGVLIKTKWSDGFNLEWSDQQNSAIVDRSTVTSLYNSLLANNEIFVVPKHLSSAHVDGCQLSCLALPDFVSDSPSVDELGHHVDTLLKSQLLVARSVCSNTPFAALLQQRLIVLQRIFYAISAWSVSLCFIIPVGTAHLVIL